MRRKENYSTQQRFEHQALYVCVYTRHTHALTHIHIQNTIA